MDISYIICHYDYWSYVLGSVSGQNRNQAETPLLMSEQPYGTVFSGCLGLQLCESEKALQKTMTGVCSFELHLCSGLISGSLTENRVQYIHV